MNYVRANRWMAVLVVPVLAAILSTKAAADFSGYYAPGNWSVFTVGDGFVDVGGAPASITIVGPNDGSGNFGYTDIIIAADVTGTFNFDWSYFSVDDPGFDTGFYINAGFVVLTDASGDSGSVSVPVNAGDIIGWSVESEDSLFGAGELTIRNFSVVAIPEPSSAMLAFLGGLFLFVRRR